MKEVQDDEKEAERQELQFRLDELNGQAVVAGRKDAKERKSW